MKTHFKLLAVVGLASTSQGALLVYEPFDYTPVDDQVAGALAGKNGGTGFGGAWIDSTSGSNGGESFIYDSNGSAGYSGGNQVGALDWDGAVDNLPTVGGYAGLSTWSNVGSGQDRLNSHRPLGTNAGALAGADGVLWLSMVVHYPNNSFFGHPGIALTDGANFEERARYISGGGSAIGTGNGTLSLWPSTDLNTLFWSGGAEVSGSKTGISNISTSLDNIIVLKFEFGPASDTVSSWFFTESDALTEAAFDANAGSSTSSIDESTLNTFAFSLIRENNAIDEIRMGDTFSDVIGVPEPGSLALIGLGLGFSAWRLRRR